MQQKKVEGQVFVNHFLRIGHCGSLVLHPLSGLMAGKTQTALLKVFMSQLLFLDSLPLDC